MKNTETAPLWLRGVVIVGSLLATLLCAIPFSPNMPDALLDDSWHFALNEAVARHLSFGTDVIFTYGPLSSVDTRTYHPQTDLLILAASAIIGSGFFWGWFLVLPRTRSLWIALLPFVISQTGFADSAFFFLPFLLLVLVARVTESEASPFYLRPDRAVLAGVALVTSAVALLPLVKLSYAGPAFLSGVLAFVILARKSPLAAGALALGAGAAMLAGWALCGQRLADIAKYFWAGRHLVSKYGEGMSTDGNSIEPLIFVGVALVLLFLPWREWRAAMGRRVISIELSLAVTLFVAFKAGFTRHDGHALYAGGVLLLAGALIASMVHSMRTLATAAAALCAWGYLEHVHSRLGPAAAFERFSSAFESPLAGLRQRLVHPAALPDAFREAEKAIRAAVPLPVTDASADLYPNALSALFASGLTWSPRPVIQSYATFTPELSELNAEHLRRSSAAKRLFFAIQPIDGRYPALEDSLSWLELLRQYDVSGRAGEYAVLDRRASPAEGSLESMTMFEGQGELGVPLSIPRSPQVIWATLELRQTLLGRVAATLFKAPQIQLILTYPGGRTSTYRFIPEMGRSGFVLSPTVDSVDAFLELASPRGDEEAEVEGRKPESMEIVESPYPDWIDSAGSPAKRSSSHHFWEPRYSVRLSTMRIPVQSSVDIGRFDRWQEDGGKSAAEEGGNCEIDVINGRAFDGKPLDVKGELISIAGWAAISAPDGRANNGVVLSVSSKDGPELRAESHKVARPDVGAYFKHPELNEAGFQSLLDARELHGDYSLRIIQRGVAGDLVCAKTVLLRR